MPSLLRYEVFVLLIWFFVELGRWYTRDQAFRKLATAVKGDNTTKHLSLKKTMSYGVLIGAMFGALVFWLIADVFCYDTFHAAQQVFSVNATSFGKRNNINV